MEARRDQVSALGAHLPLSFTGLSVGQPSQKPVHSPTTYGVVLPNLPAAAPTSLQPRWVVLPFLTAYDPVGGSSGSIDPLGALQSYGLLADLLLPGVTTVTTRSRYLSMMCAALANAENGRSFLPGASGLAQRRKAVEPFERLWAVACVAASKHGHDGAADGLRGITYAENSYREFATNGKKVTCDFPLLKYQSRTGAVGAYWTALVGGQLVHADSGALAVEGQELAEYFPELPLDTKDRARFADPEVARRVAHPVRRSRDVGRALPPAGRRSTRTSAAWGRGSPPTTAGSA